MAYDGTLKFDTSMDSSGFQKDANRLGDIVKGLGVFKLLEKGFELVTSSIDRAVSRYDIMNKFPKVLENMGFSAEASAAATKKLSDGVQGLPTALDEVVATAQQLTVLTGNLESSTDTTLALNNAFLASGSSAADASRGMVQYTQMLTKSKVDIISWRTLQETMGYALQKTAEAFGFAGQSAQNDLYAALRDGDITFSEFNAKLVELDQAVGGFADMAKTSTGGVATAFTNMRTRIAAGVTEVMSAIDRGFSKTRFKSIENIISSTGTNIKNVLSNMAWAFELVAASSEVLIPLLVAVGVAVTAWKIGGILTGVIQGFQTAAIQVSLYSLSVNGAITADAIQTAGLTLKEVVVGVLTRKIEFVTAAQWLWNAAMSANPIGVVAVAVVAATAAIAALGAAINKANPAMVAGNQYVKEFGEANKALADDLEKTTEGFQENSAAAEAATRTGREMLAGMQALASKGLGRTAKETYQLKAKINALNSAQQGLNLTIDETTGELSMTVDEIEAYFNAAESAARTTALTDHMKALSQQLVDIEAQFIDAERQLALWEEQVENGELTPFKYEKLVRKLNQKMEELQATQQKALEEMEQNEEAYSQVLAQQEQQRKALLDLQEDEIRAFAAQHHLSFDEIRANMDENNLSFAEWQDENQKTLDKGQETLAEFADKWGLSLDEVNQAIADSGLTIEEYVERQDGALEHAKEVLSDYTTTVSNGFSVMEQETAISFEKFMENMRKNEEATANWAKNMNILMDLGINQGVIEQLARMGPEGAAQAQAFVDELTAMNGGVDIALGNTNEAVRTKLAEIDETFSTSLKTVGEAADTQLRAESYYQAGYASMDRVASGITENPAATNAATQAGADIAKSVTSAVETVDFSSAGQSIGDSLVARLTAAIQNGMSEITGAVTSASTQVQNVFRNMKTQAVSTTAQMMTQIHGIIMSRGSVVKAAAASMSNGVTQVVDTMKTQTENRTRQMMAAINSAIVINTSTVKSSTTALANGAVSALESMIFGAQSVANRMMDGIGTAMDNKAPFLYSKAREIANRIASTMAAALDVHSPSRVMIRLFENVMMGVYVGMDGMSGMLYRKAESITDGITERLTISPGVASAFVERMRAVTDSTPLGGASIVPQAAYAGAGGAIQYVTSLTQNITTPKPLSASEMTREGQDLLRRSQWQLP